jgi:hypothetical protein
MPVRGVAVGGVKVVEIGVERLEHAHHGRERRVHAPGFDAREIRGSEPRETRGGALREPVARTDGSEPRADFKL